MHEIVTLQFGSQANYVGTHFWNAQESYFTYEGQEESPVDHAVHFREGIGADGSDTFTPRTIIYDFKTNFGSLRRTNELYEQVNEGAISQDQLWEGSVVAQNEPQINLNAYQRSLNQGFEPSDLSKADVRFWSDFNRVFYHPKSIVQIYETELNPGQRAFDDWTSGEELFTSLDRDEDLTDRDVRTFVEECDQMQGLQIFAGSETAWAGFGSRFLDRLRDEFGKLSIWVYGVGISEGTETRRIHRTINQVKSLCEFSEQASMYIPVAGAPTTLPSYISMDKRHPWHTSALQSAGFESALIATRLKASSPGSLVLLDHLGLGLAGEDNRRIAQLSFEVGDYKTADQYTNGENSNGGGGRGDHGTIVTSPYCELFSGCQSEPASHGYHGFSSLTTERGGGWPENDDTMADDARDSSGSSQRLRTSTPLCMPLPDSFPKIFSLSNKSASSARVKARLEMTSKIGKWARSYEQAVRTVVNYQEREELCDALRSIGDSYTVDRDSEDDDYDSD